MRKKIVAGNWKMNLDIHQARELIKSVVGSLENQNQSEREIICIPPFTHLSVASELVKNSQLKLGAQNAHHEKEGAYTGEVSAKMLRSIGVDYCLVGHSERRTYQKESDQELMAKINRLLENNIEVIYCLGEQLNDRESAKEFEVVESQLQILFDLDKESFSRIVIAYEPVWAIGTGKTASSAQAQEMHHFIRETIATKMGGEVAENTSILYGGSCKPDNAEDLFSQEDVDGGLIGGASLDAKSFIAIYNSFL